MQQYIYGNIGRAGFKTVSSDRTGFFVSHASALSPLMYYDTASTHGELPKEEHKCFWLLTTNLSVPGGQDYLFLQESGMDVHRNAAVVQGCCSDPSDGELYDARFLQLLDVAFGSPKEALQTAERGDLAPLTMDALPRRNVATANLDAALLEGILVMLLRKERVVIRLPSVGARAMEDSRGYLKAIYQRLPYEARKNNGCLTGATGDMLDISRAFTIILMDGDADLTGAMPDSTTMVFDLHEGKIPQVPKDDAGKTLFYVPLLQFLTTQEPDKLDAFFQFCRSSLEGDPEGRYPDLRKYCSLLDIYSVGQGILSGEDIRKWAVNLNDSVWTREMYDSTCRKLARSIPVENMLEYLEGVLPRFASLARFGVMNRADEEKSKTEERDQNGALTLRMMLSLPGYDLDAVKRGLVEYFVSKAKETCPRTEQPTRKVLDTLDRLQLPEKRSDTLQWANAVREDVRQRLETLISRTKAMYWEENQEEDAQGQARIQQWRQSGATLDVLYEELAVFRLYEDLIAKWNKQIGPCIVDRCLGFEKPAELLGYDRLLGIQREMCDCFKAHGGSFTDVQEEQLHVCYQNLESIPELCDQMCTQGCATVAQWNHWLGELDAKKINPDLALTVKQTAAKRFLAEIPDGLPLEETKNRLKCAAHCANLLDTETVGFKPWGIRGRPEEILACVDALENYSAGDKDPDLSRERIRVWSRKYLSNNKELMVLLARKDHRAREDTVRALAGSGVLFTEWDIETLFICGCPRELLCREDISSSDSWNQAVQKCFPAWQELPKPLDRQQPGSRPAHNGFMTAMLLLIAVAAAVPGTVLWILGAGTAAFYGIIAGALTLLAVASLMAAAVQKKRTVRRFQLWLAVALLPGILTAAIKLAIIFLSR